MSIEIKTNVSREINYVAAHLKKQILVGDISLSQIETDRLVCKITAVPEFIFEYKQEIKVEGDTSRISAPVLKINDDFYRKELIEAREGEIKIELYHPDHPDHILGFLNTTVHIQPYLHWDAKMPETIAGFLQPNDPLVQMVMKKAGEYAALDGKSMCGYQCRSAEGVKKQAEYIYRALMNCNIHYISAPASFEVYGQKIRIPHQVLHEGSKQGTCLDLAVLYATCLEAASLNAAVILIPGHAFTAVWLEDSFLYPTLVKPSNMNENEWKNSMALLLPVECTTFTDGSSVEFASAVSIAQNNMSKCNYLVDITSARNEGIVPVYTFTDKPICKKEEKNFLHEEYSNTKKSKLEILRDQAMDITARNYLLNCEANHLNLSLKVDADAFFKGKVDAKEILGQNSKTKPLRELFSKSRQNMRESGKSDLYLGINELKWRQDDSGKFMNAVMYLCPIEIYRNGRGDHLVRYNYEEAFLNPALKVLLEQGFHLDSAKMKTHPGQEYVEQMQFMRFLIEHQKGWSVKENVAHIAMYHIPNEDIWNGLHDPAVLSHEIVKGILHGEMDWQNQTNLEEEQDNQGIYPFETDSSQQEIIKASYQRKAQVVVGPAGNGKTQTEVNIMLDAVRRGEKVLLVSEMAPALEVAHQKLNEVLDGHFHLHIIPGKDKPADLIRQIRRNLDYLEMNRSIPVTENGEEARKRYDICLSYLEKYYSLMGEKHACGKSLEELIDMYEKYSDSTVDFQLDDICQKISLSDAEDQIGILAKVMEEYDHAKGEFSEFICYDNLEGKKEYQTLEAAQMAIQRYETVWESAGQLRKMLRLRDCLSQKEQLQQTILIASMLRRCPVYNMAIEDIFKETEADEIFKEDLLEELGKIHRRYPSFAKKIQREKCAQMLRRVFNPRETEMILEESESNPEEMLSKVQQMKFVRDEEGGLHLDGKDGKMEEIVSYLEEMDSMFMDEAEDVIRIIKNAVSAIVKGKGHKLQGLCKQVYDDYKRYSQAQKEAEVLIIRNADTFSRKYPALPKKVLFEEWIENRNIDTNRSRSVYDSIVSDMEEQGFGSLITQMEALREKGSIHRKDIMRGFYKSWALYHIDQIQESFIHDYNFNYVIFQDKVEQMADKEQLIRKNLKQEIFQKQLERMPNVQEGICNNPEFGLLQKMVRRKNIAVRTLFEEAPNMMRELCPCMIMTPVDVAKYIPSDFPKFDLVLIDEGSQMPTYDALIPISRAKRCMIFGDEKQMQPSDEFRKKVEEEMDVSTGRESILTAAYITSMPRKMLRFHYRSEDESLIAFSNKYYYNGDIITFPSCDTRIQGVEYEFVENGVYDREHTKANAAEAERVIQRIREFYDALPSDSNQTLGVITLNIHQRNYIQKLLLDEVRADSELGMKIDDLVSIVNLESCQGKEWDYVIISPGFAKDANGKFNTAFGALNREYGANRLNVMISRARKRMRVITSIEPYMLAGAQSEGVRHFREFLQYAKGEMIMDSRVIDKEHREDGLINKVASALEEAGYEVHTNIGSSDFKVDIGVVSKEDPGKYALAILLDHNKDARSDSSIHDREIIYPQILERKGWNIYRLCELNWNNSSQREIRQILRKLAK